MPTPILIKIGNLELKGEFNDTPAGQAAAEALPFEWSGSRWGDEYYGPPTVDLGDHPGEKGTVMNVGDLGWHAPNQWFCIHLKQRRMGGLVASAKLRSSSHVSFTAN